MFETEKALEIIQRSKRAIDNDPVEFWEGREEMLGYTRTYRLAIQIVWAMQDAGAVPVKMSHKRFEALLGWVHATLLFSTEDSRTEFDIRRADAQREESL